MQDSPILSWKVAGLLLGLMVVLATALVTPFGVSTQYVVTDAIVLHSVAPKAAESNKYLNKYGEKGDWGIGYGWMLVAGMFLGSGIAAVATHRFRRRKDPAMSEMWTAQFGNHKGKRFVQAFIGGLLLLFGARFAGGCTSGHMISGISQLTIGSFVFGIAIFISGIITAKMLYRKRAGS
jgi:uncharacterized membrane protein YedE/YeeE